MTAKKLVGEELAKRLALYVVTDERTNGGELLPILERAIAGGVTAVQLRRKTELGKRFLELAFTIRELTRQHGVLFFVNDRVDIAALVDADGVHVGQDDIPCEQARRLLGPNAYIGVSAETVEEAVIAEKAGADYLGVGAVYPTISKPDAGYTGLQGLRKIKEAVQIPVVAIGGIYLANTAEVMSTGVDGIAVVSAVMSAEDPRESSTSLLETVQNGIDAYRQSTMK